METFSFQAIISKGIICIKMTEFDFFLLDSSGVMLSHIIAIISKLRNIYSRERSTNPHKHLGDRLQFNCLFVRYFPDKLSGKIKLLKEE